MSVHKRDAHKSLSLAVEQLRDLLAQDKTARRDVVVAWGIVRALAKSTELDSDTAKLIDDLGDRAGRIYGMTDAIRSALFEAPRPLSAVEVREWLRETGFDVRKYSFAMAAIHSTLKRLVQQGEVKVLVDRGGYKRYLRPEPRKRRDEVVRGPRLNRW